ncbi:hypothetical protein B0H17DRAFT_1131118 [Mycena rosella]|uniref:F-box domain-containing protein n=1 Tax=Mycena rosella TaxID=1033263 RepID=A0AAD7GNC5_MYCRO|nr:hypothetical protein B0H17DRAFT_1131118 [Mycena rosella]
MDALPIETLVKIFRFTCNSFFDSAVKSMRNWNAVHAVSRWWCAVGSGDSVLWAAIYLYHGFTEDALKSQITRTRAAPLSICLNLTGPRPFELLDWAMPLLQPSFIRCIRFRLTSTNVGVLMAVFRHLKSVITPNLEEIHLDAPFPAVMQQFRALRDNPPDHPLVPFPSSGSLPRLTCFAIERSFTVWGAIPYYHTLLSLHLSHLHNCAELALEDYFMLKTRRVAPPDLLHLDHLEFGNLLPSAVAIIALPYLLAVRTVHWFADQSDNVSHVIAHYGPLFNGVTTTVIDLDTQIPTDLATILAVMPNIRRLDLRRSVYFIADAFRDACLSQSGLPTSLVQAEGAPLQLNFSTSKYRLPICRVRVWSTTKDWACLDIEKVQITSISGRKTTYGGSISLSVDFPEHHSRPDLARIAAPYMLKLFADQDG